jgi:hypothetical protein
MQQPKTFIASFPHTILPTVQGGGGLPHHPHDSETVPGQHAGDLYSHRGWRFRTPMQHCLCRGICNCHTDHTMGKPNTTRMGPISDRWGYSCPNQRSKAPLGGKCENILNVMLTIFKPMYLEILKDDMVEFAYTSSR